MVQTWDLSGHFRWASCKTTDWNSCISCITLLLNNSFTSGVQQKHELRLLRTRVGDLWDVKMNFMVFVLMCRIIFSREKCKTSYSSKNSLHEYTKCIIQALSFSIDKLHEDLSWCSSIQTLTVFLCGKIQASPDLSSASVWHLALNKCRSLVQPVS